MVSILAGSGFEKFGIPHAGPAGCIMAFGMVRL
jgi:hypothetical protein